MLYLFTVSRSAFFLALQALLTVFFSAVALLTFPFTLRTRYRVISSWSRLMVWLARLICGIRYEVIGLGNLPSEPSIVLSKHQSAWETLVFQVILPPQVWVLRRSLLKVPFFGWGLAMMKPIAIDRDAGMRALKQTLEQGRERLREGFWIIVFPEGTRVPPGETGTYQVGGAWLAKQTGAPVVPVAHNAGYLWQRNAFVKFPGKITVSIGKPIDTTGLSVNEINERTRDWIESEMRKMGSSRCS
ncbi:MAG: lysophospholipid acyltransferase family protein [Burkholderiales bacterium]